MKRDQHKLETKNRVLKISRNLFVQQGYSKTTIKQISRKANITTGSLYHFFQNKEDILLHIVGDVVSKSAEISDVITGNENDPCLRFSLEIALQLEVILKFERIGEIYLAAYNSWQISKLIVRMGAERNEEIFKTYNPDFTAEDYYTRTLAIKGILHSFIDEFVHYRRIDDHKRIHSILEMILLIFNIPEKQIRRTINKTQRIIEKINLEHSPKFDISHLMDLIF
ncbi:MAG: TetR/AcrR family transcriptional regulator [Deltaproteobacteria bacterium HGW-Deltaproteobacteria-13]|jgi:AcrR family transcriptional regulator|nr:MAG: TetR/AcrR family transcriptional regulator [Deltaproteobacteria bacterium HGW-Deltaproteobacteria-13]